MITTKEFWIDTAVRAVRTFAQSLAAAIGVGATGVLEVDWLSALSVAALAAVLSVLTNIGSDALSEAPRDPVEPRHAQEED